MTDLLLKSTGPVADQYKVLAGVGATDRALALDFGLRPDQSPPRAHGYGATREVALQAFAKNWSME